MALGKSGPHLAMLGALEMWEQAVAAFVQLCFLPSYFAFVGEHHSRPQALALILSVSSVYSVNVPGDRQGVALSVSEQQQQSKDVAMHVPAVPQLKVHSVPL